MHEGGGGEREGIIPGSGPWNKIEGRDKERRLHQLHTFKIYFPQNS